MIEQIKDEGLTCAYLLGKSDGYKQGKVDAIKELKDASIIFDGEEIYGSKTKVILITEGKYNEIFKRKGVEECKH